jgi:hypothetical protein
MGWILEIAAPAICAISTGKTGQMRLAKQNLIGANPRLQEVAGESLPY